MAELKDIATLIVDGNKLSIAELIILATKK